MNKAGWILIWAIMLLVVLAVQVLAQPLPIAKPEEVGMNSKQLHRVAAAIQSAIDNKEFPGAVLLVSRKGKIVMRAAFGRSQWVPEERSMTIDMIFDLASITKPVATATSIMILVEQGRIRLWDKVKDFVPDFVPYFDDAGLPSEDARIWHLLTHTSGLPPYTNAKEIEMRYGTPCPMDSLVRHIAQLKKIAPPGTAFHYSCLGFITLAYIIHHVTGQTIAEFSEQNIFKPLSMNHTFYCPSERYRELCVPTEVIDGRPLIGIVHDPLARVQGGISGNAGLFSTADDLAIFAQMMLNKGEFKGVRILSPLSVERMTEVYDKAQFAGRGLGWDLNSDYSTNGGDLFGGRSYGHTGYTGTSIWIDPETETFIIFLTNRVHPNDKGSIISLRSKVANIVASSIVKK
ncbi:MAG: beta-lactamase family protein [candidate division KSB1 bacterium]|nr:beta-lactamase family protein [candidate division KSB1 bacterium]MDZ7334086.1 beta-lactamase family protein [candidate division KSB1 bacterium]MDZ7357073.1 beta-lactamase family protein [candidate division KSB1 bacterium]MDZ7399574.1 beta-lactamase family protein [candidate division KSB1 bacterium]